MSSKRRASTELNHENWDQEEPDDDKDDGTGAFKIASKDILEKRVIRTAKRRSQVSSEEGKKSVFSGFSGFNKTQPSSFDFLSNLTNGSKTNTAPTTKTEIGLFGSNNTKTLSSPSSLFSSGITQSISKSTTENSNPPLFGSSFKTKPTPTVFNTSTPETKLDNPFKVQNNSSAFASFGPKNNDNVTIHPSSANVFGGNSVSKVTSSNNSATATNNSTVFKIQPTSTTSTSDNVKKNEDAKLKYYSKLKGLNESVSDWIKQHVDKTPLCILSPIFKDYEKYLCEIQDEYESNKRQANKEQLDSISEKTSNSNSVTKPFNTNSPKSVFSSNTSNMFSMGDKAPSFSFGVTTNSTTPATASTPIFGIKSSEGTTSTPAAPSNGNTPFSFGIVKPFSFNSNIKQNEEQAKPENEDEDDEPPKVEFTPVQEENSVYDKKCKVFVKKDGNFVDKGVGTMYIKKIEESGKYQLLVRANTSLGNVLLNFVLSSTLPTQRMGKNNIMMVCIPTPECKPPPVPVLVRVKTTEEADDLLGILEKYKT